MCLAASRPTRKSAFLSGQGVRGASSLGASSGCRRATTRMNVFGRISRVVRSYVNAVITAAEDPEKMLEQTVTDLQGDLVKMRQAAAQVMASTKQLEKRVESANTQSAEWYRRAKLAVEKGEDDLAKEALKRKKAADDNAESMRAQLEQQSAVLQKLLADTRTLENKVSEAKSKKDTLKARAQSAKASRALSDMTSGIDTQSSLAAFERMEEKVIALESEAEAATALTGENFGSQFAALEEGGAIEDELAALKQDALPGASAPKPQGQLPASKFSDAIEAEFENLKNNE